MSREFIFKIDEDGSKNDKGAVCFTGKCTGEEIVRCKDCKHNSKNGGTCEHICIDVDDDWYCADGEKVEE